MLNDSSRVNKLSSEIELFQSTANKTCGRVLYIRASRNACTMFGRAFPFSHLEIRLASVSPSRCATFFCEYPAQCLYFLRLLGNRPFSMHRFYAITVDDIRQGKLLIWQMLWKTQTTNTTLSLSWAQTRLKNLYLKAEWGREAGKFNANRELWRYISVLLSCGIH